MKKKWIFWFLGAMFILLVVVSAYIAGGQTKNNSDEKSSSKATTSKVVHKSSSENKAGSSSMSSALSSSTVASSQDDSNLMEVSDFDGGLFENPAEIKAVVFYAVMTGANDNDRMWDEFKKMLQNPAQYPTIQVNLKSMATGMYLTSGSMGGVDVSWPTIMWSWGEKVQNPAGQPDFVAKGQSGSFEFSKQNVVDYVNSNGGKSMLESINLNVTNEKME